MPHNVYILLIQNTSQEGDPSIMSMVPISDWFRPFHRQLYSSTDGSSQIMEPGLKSITPINLRHLLQSLDIIHITYFSRMGSKYRVYRPNISSVPTIL